MEREYMRDLSRKRQSEPDNLKLLLPIKTKDGAIVKKLGQRSATEIEDSNQNVTEEPPKKKKKINKKFVVQSEEIQVDPNRPIAMVELIAQRENAKNAYRCKIGELASEVLEDPEKRYSNVTALIRFMDEKNANVRVTVCSLTIKALLEIFLDILPEYSIRSQEGPLKKETIQLQKYETHIIKCYEQYLKKLEKMVGVLKQKIAVDKMKKDDIYLAKLSIKVMCKLLTSQPYFNFSTNIATFLVPYLNHRFVNIREQVANCFSELFKEDKRGQLSLLIVQKINKYIVAHYHKVHSEMLTVLLGLKISESMVKDKDQDKKTTDFSKEKRSNFTKITEVLYLIYFRTLKNYSNSSILTSCLEGLAKFAPCINIDFYADLVAFLNNLLENEELNLKQQLYCIHSALLILNIQAATINVDPTTFHTHFYRKLLDIHAGTTSSELSVILKTMTQVIVKRYKMMTPSVVIAFIKRIFTASLNLDQETALEIIQMIKPVMLNCKGASNLVETDCDSTVQFYLPENDCPENSSAYGTSLWEIVALQRHPSTAIQATAKSIVKELLGKTDEYSLNKLAKFSQDSQKPYDPNYGSFLTTAPLPKKAPKRCKVHDYQVLKLIKTIDPEGSFNSTTLNSSDATEKENEKKE
ncbi:nucleolar complex protein 3 homolog, partial [Trichogramma pretiosum]|uniref:nucleolar complex protein 3 homolog n=1 Tax=Trichogramma pretiosum TaxID=7493 RepID=UPI0006C96A1F